MKRSTIEDEIRWRSFLHGSIVGILAGIGICGILFISGLI